MVQSGRYAIPEDVLRANRHVFRHMVDGERVWVKKRRPDKNPLGWWTQKLLYAVTGNILLMPPDRPTGDNVTFEVAMLRKMRSLGVNVPEVLYVTDTYFVLPEIGVSLEVYLRNNGPEAKAMIPLAATALKGFHDRGLAHGGAQIKNLMVYNGEIYFIDFEENIPAEHLRLFQIRDVFLFLLSLERCGHNPDIYALCRTYDPDGGEALFEEIRRAVRQFGVARVVNWRLLSRLSMRDIRNLSRFVEKVENGAATVHSAS
ncbi:MAG: hypothetical protein LUG50_10415 [Planctomycetaceae bacterium]|nr:hypothetical protein [Planctomycetaceae bacterium]